METGLSVFLSHSHLDEAEVKFVERFLQEIEIRTWVSYSNIDIIDQQPEIEKQIEYRDFFLLVHSKASARSRQVRREINHADRKEKKIIIYELSRTDFPQGLGFLNDNQRIEAHKFQADCLERLARLIIKEAGLSWETYSAKAKELNDRIRREQLESKKIHQLALGEYKELYWDHRTKYGKTRNDEEITALGKEELDHKRIELGLTENDLARVRTDFDRRPNTFKHLFRNALNQKELTHRELITIERKRIETCVSKNEIKAIISGRKRIPILTLDIASSTLNLDTDSNRIDISYLIALLKKRSSDLQETTTTESKEEPQSPLPRVQPAELQAQAFVAAQANASNAQAEATKENPTANVSPPSRKPDTQSRTSQAANKPHAQTRPRSVSSRNQKLDLTIAISVSEYAESKQIKTAFKKIQTVITKSLSHDGATINIAQWNAEKKSSQSKALITKPPITRIVAHKDQIVIYHANNKEAIALEIRERMDAYNSALEFLESLPLQIDRQPSLFSEAIALETSLKEDSGSNFSSNVEIKSRQDGNSSRESQPPDSLRPAINELVIISQTYLGNWLGNLELCAAHLHSSGIIFEGKPIYRTGSQLAPNKIRSLRNIEKVEIFADKICLYEFGHETYITIKVNVTSTTHGRFVEFLKPLNAPTSYRGHSTIASPEKTNTSSNHLSASGPPENIKKDQPNDTQTQTGLPPTEALIWPWQAITNNQSSIAEIKALQDQQQKQLGILANSAKPETLVCKRLEEFRDDSRFFVGKTILQKRNNLITKACSYHRQWINEGIKSKLLFYLREDRRWFRKGYGILLFETGVLLSSRESDPYFFRFGKIKLTFRPSYRPANKTVAFQIVTVSQGSNDTICRNYSFDHFPDGRSKTKAQNQFLCTVRDLHLYQTKLGALAQAIREEARLGGLISDFRSTFKIRLPDDNDTRFSSLSQQDPSISPDLKELLADELILISVLTVHEGKTHPLFITLSGLTFISIFGGEKKAVKIPWEDIKSLDRGDRLAVFKAPINVSYPWNSDRMNDPKTLEALATFIMSLKRRLTNSNLS